MGVRSEIRDQEASKEIKNFRKKKNLEMVGKPDEDERRY